MDFLSALVVRPGSVKVTLMQSQASGKKMRVRLFVRDAQIIIHFRLRRLIVVVQQMGQHQIAAYVRAVRVQVACRLQLTDTALHLAGAEQLASELESQQRRIGRATGQIFKERAGRIAPLRSDGDAENVDHASVIGVLFEHATHQGLRTRRLFQGQIDLCQRQTAIKVAGNQPEEASQLGFSRGKVAELRIGHPGKIECADMVRLGSEHLLQFLHGAAAILFHQQQPSLGEVHAGMVHVLKLGQMLPGGLVILRIDQ